MNHVIQLIWILYFFVLIPVMCGIAWDKCQERKKKSLSYIYVYGYLLYFSVFYVYARLAIQIGVSFTNLAKGWFVTGSILFLVTLVFGFHEIPKVIKDQLAFLKRCKKDIILVTVLFAVIALFSVLFVIPSPEDATPETLMVTMATDTVYLQDPYTGVVHETPIEKYAKAPITMLYASVCKYTGLTPAKFVHGVLPIPFFLLFYFVYQRIARQLFGKKEKSISLFFLIVIFCYSGSIYAKRIGAFGVFQNIWMPETLLLNVLMPFVFYECVNLMNYLMKVDAFTQKKTLWCYACKFLLLFLSGSLLHYSGGFFVLLLLTVSLVIVGIRRVYRKCRQ